jgi:nucleoside 2-deoxyribosyltransferase
MAGIANADAVFVWLEDTECYGTLIEVGYAFAMKKPIYLAHAPNVFPNGEMWFAFKAAQMTIQSSNARDAFLSAIKYVDGLSLG